MKTQVFKTIIEPDQPKGFHGFVPMLPGVHTYGLTIAEVSKNLREAVKCHIQGLLKDHETVPQQASIIESTLVFEASDFSRRMYA